MTKFINRIIFFFIFLALLSVLVFVIYDLGKAPNKLVLESIVQAGNIDYAKGGVSVIKGNGKHQALFDGDRVDVGDTIKTSVNAKTKISFVDKSEVTLYENSEMKVIEFAENKKGSGKNIMRLIRGELRALSGLIGKRKGDIYKMRSNIATIGIRGTEYTLRVCGVSDCLVNGAAVLPGMYMGVIEGEIVATSNAGEAVISKGEFFYQKSNSTSAKKIDVIAGLMASESDFTQIHKPAVIEKVEDKREWIIEKIR